MSYRVDENGNYVRTVRCGHCYEQGHNKSSCKAKKQHHENYVAEYEKEIADDNFADDWERDNTKRLLERHKASLNKSVNRGKNRKCSYCKDEGHTRRTCSFRKGDMNDYAAKCVASREKFVENMTAVGFGIGALGWKKTHWGEEQTLTIVESINWRFFTHHSALGETYQYTEFVTARSLTPTERHPTGVPRTVLLPSKVSNINNMGVSLEFERRCFEVVSPVNPSFPEDFLTLESGLEAAATSEDFNDSRPYSYHGITYDE